MLRFSLFSLLLVAAPALAVDPDAHEPNGNFNTATAIDHGFSEVLTIHENGGDVDFFSFTLNQAADLQIWTSAAPDPVQVFTDTRMWLYDGDEQQVEYDDDGGDSTYSSISRTNQAAGTYYIKVDEYGQNAEINYMLNFRIIDGNLSTQAGQLDPAPVIGALWGARVTVRNHMGAIAPPTITRLTADGNQLDAPLTYDCETPELAANNGTFECVWADLAALPFGVYTLSMCADATGLVNEADEENNCREFAARVGPDLAAQDLVLAPVTPDVGETWAATANIVNTESGTVAATTAALKQGEVVLGTCAVPELAQGASHECSWADLEGLPSGNTAVSVCSDHNEEVGELNEANNCAVLELSIGSDLISETFSIDPINPGLQDRWSASVSIRNRFAPDTPPTIAQLFVGDISYGQCQVPALAAGASHTCELTDLDPPPQGRHAVRFCADVTEVIGERSEDNNCSEINIFNGPDLQIQQLILNPNPPIEGRSSQLFVMVRNSTGDAAEASHVSISEEGQAIVADCPVIALQGGFIGSCSFGNLNFSGGQHNLTICVDSQDEIIEVDEDNNCQDLDFFVENVDAFEPDNSIEEARILSPDVAQLHSIHNNDDIDIVRIFVNAESEVHLSTDPSVEGDTFDTSLDLLNANGEQIANNDNSTRNGELSTYSTIVHEVEAGTYFGRVRRARGATIERYDLNLRVIPLASRPPDLFLSNFVLDPVDPEANAPFVASFDVGNVENGGVSEPSLHHLTIDGELAGTCNVGTLEAGAVLGCQIAVAAGMTLGEHTLQVCADPDDAITERSENNNCTQMQLRTYGGDDFEPDNDTEAATDVVLGEPQAHSIHAPSDVDMLRVVMAEPGTVTVSATVEANGIGDIDGELLASDGTTVLERGNGVGPVALEFGPLDAGTVYVKLSGNRDQRVSGYSVTVTVAPIEGGALRDLMLSNILLDPERPEVNTGALGEVQISNLGNLYSADSTVQLLLDGEAIDDCPIPPLRAGRTHRCRDLAVPGMAEGEHTLRACVDPDNAVDESDEDNNCAEMTFNVGDPVPPRNDLWMRAPRLTPAAPEVGENASLRVQVMYTGDSSSDATTVEVKADGNVVFTCNVPSLDGRFNRSSTCTTARSALQATEAAQVLSACIDPENAIDETDESNNCINLLMRPGGLVGLAPDVYEDDGNWEQGGYLADTDVATRAQVHSLHTADDVDVIKFTIVRPDVITVKVEVAVGELAVDVVTGLGGGDAGPPVVMNLPIAENGEGIATSETLEVGTYGIYVRSGDGRAVPEYRLLGWTQAGPVRPDAGPAPPDAGPAGECSNHHDCTGGFRCNLDDSEPYCAPTCETVADCPEGFQLTCREVELGLRLCIRGDAPAPPTEPPGTQGCSCDSAGPAALLPLLFLVLLGLRRRREDAA
jgi:MYXO-CTERM domain-containing protein